MSDARPIRESLWPLIDAAFGGSLTPAQAEELQELLETNREACAFYGQCARIEAELYLLARRRASQAAVAREVAEAGGREAVAGGQRPEARVQASGNAATLSPFAIRHSYFSKSPNPQVHLPPSTSLHPPFFAGAWQGTVNFFSQEVPFAILMATLIFVVAGVVGWFIPIRHATQFASLPSFGAPSAAGHVSADGQSVLPALPARKAPESKIPEVAQITGMVDCEFSDNLAPMHNRIGIGHNNKFALSKGLMEITYFSGAKVLLQGPCTYEIDSAAGGFLSIGRLTAHIEVAKPQAAKTEDSNPQSPTPKPFAVKTPTAVVTDLGTEFGVDVDAAGITQAKVFRGKVVFVALAGGQPQGRAVELGENQSARVERASGGDEKTTVVVLQDKDAKPVKFVRNIQYIPQTSYGEAVMEDRPFAYWPLNETGDVSYVADRSGNKHHGFVYGKLGFGKPGPLADEKSRSVEFDGKSYIEVNPPLRNDPAKGFSIEAWARIGGEKPKNWWYAVVANIDWSDSPRRNASYGYVLYSGEGDAWQFRTGDSLGSRQDVLGEPGVVAVKDTWAYLVATFEPTEAAADGTLGGMKKLYLDGKLVLSRQQSQGYAPNASRPFRIGANSDKPSYAPKYYFVGNLAEIAIYDRPLPEDRIKAHWEAAKDAGIKKEEQGTKPLAASR